VRREMSAGRGRHEELTGMAFVPAGRPSATPRRKGSGVVMVSERLIQRWEAVYREYGTASQRLSGSEPGDRAVARYMARASADVAALWREMAAEPGMPWWSVAALCAAAQAFEYQTRDWSARAKYDSASDGPSRGSSRRPHPQVTSPAGEGGGAWSR
jgi:hypothetical protein